MTEQAATSSDRVAVSCPGCEEKYFVDPAKIPPQGGKLTCRICGGRIVLAGRGGSRAAASRPPDPPPAGDPKPAIDPPQHPPASTSARPSLPVASSGVVVCPHCRKSFVPQAAPRDPAAPSPARQKTVLIVEDTEFFLRLAQDTLASRYRTVCAATASDALRILRQEPVDLLILDIALQGGEDGLSVLGGVPKGLPCLIFTADETGMYGDAWTHLQEKGASDLLLKGMNIEEQLLKKAASLLSD